jgi:signal transduction histidine kinase
MQGRGQIHASATRTETALTLRICDEGPGLTSEVVQRMFEPFFTTKHQGTGLGLVTARKILEAHNGTLELENAPHGGAIATVTLPMPRA